MDAFEDGTRIVSATEETIRRIWSDRWGIPILTPTNNYGTEEVDGLALVRGEEPAALVTWSVSGPSAEIISLDALIEGRGYGSRLLDAAERRLAERGVRRVHLVTTNDNTLAFGFYIRRGYRLRRIYFDAMESARRIKPAIPETGDNGVPIRDLWELDKAL